MLKPFLIRDLDEDHQTHDIIEDSASDLYNATDVSVGPQRRHGLVQLAAADYDELTYIHPHARLTYLDEDDGEIITVGSSLELAQRLDDPPPQITDTGFPATIHLFDIKRRTSIIDLWKRFECDERMSTPESLVTQVVVDDLDNRATTSELNTSREVRSHFEDGPLNTTESDQSESFLSAFEAEMAKVMDESRRLENNTSESTASSRTTPAESTSNLPQERAEAFASALRSLIEVAEAISSGVKSKLPELERHLDNARRALPSDITDSMRNAFAAFEAQLKAMASTLNNLPETIRRENGPGNARLFPELPTAYYSAINGLHEMGAQLGGMGQALLSTFESSVRGAFPGHQDGFFSGFPNFSESNDHPASVPNNVAGSFSSVRGDAASRLAARSDNLPGVFPFGLSPTTVPNPSSHSVYYDHPQPRLYPMSSYASRPAPFTTNPGFGAAPQPHETLSGQPPEPLSLEHPSRSLFIGNVGFNVTERMVKDVFTSKGLRVGVHLPLDSRTGKHAGFGYLTFPSDFEATSGLRELQGAVIDGHCINLESIDHSPITALMFEDVEEAKEAGPATVSSPQTSGVVRRDTADDPLTSVPDDNIGPKPSNETVHDLLLAQTEARFPPVSQLDAHMLTEQSPGTRQAATSPETRNSSDAEEARDATLMSTGKSQFLPGSFPQETHNHYLYETPVEPQSTPTTQRNHHPHNHRHSHNHSQHNTYSHPRRAETVRLPEPHRRVSDIFEPLPGLRRRATERHSLRSGSIMDAPGPRHRASFHHLSQPAPEPAPNLRTHEEEPAPHMTRKQAKRQRKQRAINECVAALAQMGYGSEEDGGNQRLAIYAAAAKGELIDAIEMIEEERKAYEQRA